jgi:hypothetical protein
MKTNKDESYDNNPSYWITGSDSSINRAFTKIKGMVKFFTDSCAGSGVTIWC